MATGVYSQTMLHFGGMYRTCFILNLGLQGTDINSQAEEFSRHIWGERGRRKSFGWSMKLVGRVALENTNMVAVGLRAKRVVAHRCTGSCNIMN